MKINKDDRVISEFLRSIGQWSEHVIIGGGYALIIYKLYLADHISNPPVGTKDIDSLIPRQVNKISGTNIANHLTEAGFTRIFKDYEHPATEAYIKDIHGIEVEIEFLTDSAARDDKHKNVEISGVVAQPLSYLTISLKKTREFTTYSGVTGLVVSPGAWMFHKGLTFMRRHVISKIYKDLYGIWYVASQLQDFSENSITELKQFGLEYPKWYKTFKENLGEWVEKASISDWEQLENQDPYGELKRKSFERVVNQLIG